MGLIGQQQRILESLRRRIRRLRGRKQQQPPQTPPPPHRQVLSEMGPELTDIVLVARRGAARLADELARQRPSAVIHLLAVQPVSAKRRADLEANVIYAYCPDQKRRLRELASKRQPQLIIERGLEHTGERVDTFRELFGLVAVGGRYVIDSMPPLDASSQVLDEARRTRIFLTELAELAGTPQADHTYDVELARSIGAVEALPGGWIIDKRVSHQWKMRDRYANRILQARFGSEWGEVIATKPAVTHVSRARGVTHGEGLRTLRPEFNVPDRWLRRYRGVTCYARKRVRLGDYWLPDTFRNPRMRVLNHQQLRSASPTMARAPDDQEAPSRTLEGPFFHLDSEYFSHFGHVLTDVVGKTWGWQQIKQSVPELRPLVSLPATQAAIPGFQRQIFTALDIDPDSVEYVRPGSAVRVEQLYGCTSDWALPRYCAPELVDVWERIRLGCMNRDLTSTPELIFISRRPRELRTCLNAEDVEIFFAQRGFTILYPEDLSFGDQVANFAGARVIAGFAGSGMFNAMFAPQVTLLVLAGDSYTGLNEYLIKSLVGGDIHYFWSKALLRHPTGGWSWDAYRSNFVFDLERFGTEIDDVLNTLAS